MRVVRSSKAEGRKTANPITELTAEQAARACGGTQVVLAPAGVTQAVLAGAAATQVGITQGSGAGAGKVAIGDLSFPPVPKLSRTIG